MRKLENGNYEITEKELKEFLTLKHKSEALSLQVQGDWDDIYFETIDIYFETIEDYLECYREENEVEISSIDEIVNYEIGKIK